MSVTDWRTDTDERDDRRAQQTRTRKQTGEAFGRNGIHASGQLLVERLHH